MPRQNNYYSQANHTVIVEAVDGTFRKVLADFAEGDDAIGAEVVGERVALTQGFDRGIVNFSSYKGGKISIKLKPTSRDEGFLNQLLNRQSTTPILVNVLIQSGVKDVTRLENAGLNKDSFSTGGPTASARGWSFLGTKILFDEDEG